MHKNIQEHVQVIYKSLMGKPSTYLLLEHLHISLTTQWGGSEFIVTALIAKKFHFVPNYIPALTFDPVPDHNLTLVGMVSSLYIK